ncbi:TetR/AcrR family transcriptional regulator [Paraburkholderia bryophila]|uniref:TetR/AcrR family transcriptional regulator n=1 Tax=Paraburkholderia bryophila TaxID=420952 RepID=UPI00234AA6AA|nr:TetR/AcrR family transcriptional regulator [Paraburkholderia bryophila]WCM23653.1 TetR/AcrR family transcriptional regulator [Paraburkholderia bryophila]
MAAHNESSNSRDKILDAAAALVTKHGVTQLTIQGTADAVGITKAGLIYHFKTRDDLLTALLDRMVAELDAQIGLPAPNDAEPISLRAKMAELTSFTFDMPATQKQLMTNMLAAASTHPNLLPPVQALFTRSYEALDGGPDAGLAQLLSVALDGLLLLELLQLHKFTPDQRAAMRKTVEKLTRDLP